MKERFVFLAIAGFMLLASSLGAAPPSVFMVNPRSTAVVNIGDNVYLKAQASDPGDPGGSITQVDFYTNGVLLGSATAPPFAVWWSNAVGDLAVRAVAIDNSLDRSTSAVVNIIAVPPMSRNLSWFSSTPTPEEAQWNTRDFRWYESFGGGRLALFHPGDSVGIYSWNPIFIGVDGVPVPVSPGSTANGYAMMLHGGDILTGSLMVMNGGAAVFTNYAGSLNFPGGTLVRQPGFGLTFNIARAPQGASVHLGTGPITVIDSRFQFDLTTNQFATLENDFYCEMRSAETSLQPAPFQSSNATARFTGDLNLAGRLTMRIGNGTRQFFMEGARDPDYHEWAGSIILNQNTGIAPGFILQGNYRSKGLLLSGNIKDGGGISTNRLTLQTYAVPVIRLIGSNTYAHGTFIDQSPSAPQGWVEVAPESSLGRGNVEVRGVLHLMGNGNIHSNATVNIQQGRTIIDTGVKVRVSRVILGSSNYTAGIFSRTNTFGRIVSNGTIRVPAVNLQPSVVIINPVSGARLTAAGPLEIRARATDQDSYIERVDFYVDGTLVGTRTNFPYTVSIANTPIGQHALHAVIYDDDGGTSTSPTVNVTVAPAIDAIRYVETNVVVIEFRAPADQTIELQATDSLTTTMWATLGSFSGAGMTTPHTVTNSIPAEVPTRYYRLRSP
jgi:hypothetical protein